jgi:hypothetical protein
MHASDDTTIDQVASETHDTDLSDEALDRAPARGGVRGTEHCACT